MGNWDGLIVICATSRWDGMPLLERHVAEELAEQAPILYVEPVTSPLTRFRNQAAAQHASREWMRTIGPRFAVMSPHAPPLMHRTGVKALSLSALRRQLKSAVRRLGSPQVEAMIVTSLDPVLGTLGERVSIYYAKDNYRAAGHLIGLSESRINRWVTELTQTADCVVTVSPHLAQEPRFARTHPIVIPNGCDVDRWRASGLPDVSRTPVAAYIGRLSDRVDISLLESVADTGTRLRLIGPKQRTLTAGSFDSLIERHNVTWTGGLPYRELPAALADVTTCLLPYADNEFNRSSFPLKLLEYLAAGRRVVSTSLPATRWLDTGLIEVADEPARYALITAQSLSYPLTEEEAATRRSFAANHTWKSRVQTLLDETGLRTQGFGEDAF